MDTPEDVDFAGVGPVFAIVDQPIVHIVDHTIARGAVLRWEPVWVDGDHQLTAFVLANEALPGVFLIHLATTAGRRALERWLRTLPPDLVLHDPRLGEDAPHAAMLHAVLQHFVGTFWEAHMVGDRPR
jgi:hypothetical protein